MLIVQNVRPERLLPADERGQVSFHARIQQPRSDIPAVTHVDNSARIQTVNEEQNPGLYQLIKAFRDLTGCGLLINTSFNVRGEPIVCTPSDAYRCFMRSGMDYLVLGSHLLDKRDQPPLGEDGDWQSTFGLD